jgi:dUTPase
MRQLDVNAAVGDEDYQDELHLSVTNTSTKTQYIIPGEKLVQFLLVPVKLDEPEEVSIDELFRLETIRGKGCFGSTNEKKNSIKLATGNSANYG